MYADDACIWAAGSDPMSCYLKVQKALDIAVQWGTFNSMKLSTSKTVAMLFTRKNDPPHLPLIKMYQGSVKYVDQVRHLGLLMTRKLRWLTHLKSKVESSKKQIYRHMGQLGKYYGMKPLLASYIMKGIIRPGVSFGILIWCPTLRNKTHVDELKRLQSKSFKILTYFRKGTPVRGLELVTNTIPIHIFLMRTAAKAYIRTRDWQVFSDEEMEPEIESDIGHRQFVSRYLD